MFFTHSASVLNELSSKSTFSRIIAGPANGITVWGHGSRWVKIFKFSFFSWCGRGAQNSWKCAINNPPLPHTHRSINPLIPNDYFRHGLVNNTVNIALVTLTHGNIAGASFSTHLPVIYARWVIDFSILLILNVLSIMLEWIFILYTLYTKQE